MIFVPIIGSLSWSSQHHSNRVTGTAMHYEIIETCSQAPRAVSSTTTRTTTTTTIVETCSPASRAVSSSPLLASSLAPLHHVVLRLVPRVGHDDHDSRTFFQPVPRFPLYFDSHIAAKMCSGSPWKRSRFLYPPPLEIDFIFYLRICCLWFHFHLYFAISLLIAFWISENISFISFSFGRYKKEYFGLVLQVASHTAPLFHFLGLCHRILLFWKPLDEGLLTSPGSRGLLDINMNSSSSQ